MVLATKDALGIETPPEDLTVEAKEDIIMKTMHRVVYFCLKNENVHFDDEGLRQALEAYLKKV